jgi:transcriptional regulator with XRE-family HTH domain
MSNTNKLYYKICREQSGLTQEQAIALLGIAEVATLSRYENGHSPVSQDLVAAMVKIYRTPALAKWHIEYANPDLVSYLRIADKPITDGDAMLQIELSDDDITSTRAAVKSILRNGVVTTQEAEELKVNALSLRKIANNILSAATYLEGREVNHEHKPLKNE